MWLRVPERILRVAILEGKGGFEPSWELRRVMIVVVCRDCERSCFGGGRVSHLRFGPAEASARKADNVPGMR